MVEKADIIEKIVFIIIITIVVGLGGIKKMSIFLPEHPKVFWGIVGLIIIIGIIKLFVV